MNRKYRKAIIAGNWKMNMTASEVRPYIEELRSLMPRTKTCETVLCVPSLLLPALLKATKESRIAAGGEDVSSHESGAYTGEVSAAMLSDLGVKYCIVGHSERRQYHQESDALVNAKIRQLVAHSINPIICVGETLEQREAGLTMDRIAYEVKSALYGMEDLRLRHCVIAYEPIWAIGTGRTATAEQAEEVCCGIRTLIRSMFGARQARALSILYGGSMNAENAEELLVQPDVDGGLIGGASLKPAEFSKILKATDQGQ